MASVYRVNMVQVNVAVTVQLLLSQHKFTNVSINEHNLHWGGGAHLNGH